MNFELMNYDMYQAGPSDFFQLGNAPNSSFMGDVFTPAPLPIPIPMTGLLFHPGTSHPRCD